MRSASQLTIHFLITSGIVVAGCSRESYGLVARLGNDTISIERITRKGRNLVSEVAERSPRAMRKHWEAKLDANGNVRRFTMERRLLNPAADEAPLMQTTIEFGADSVRVTVDSAGVTKRQAVRSDPDVNAPWNPYVYGTYELLLRAAARINRDSVRVHQFIPAYGRGHGVVRRRPDGSVAFVSTRLAGTGLATLDSSDHLLAYDGRNTTYKQLVERITDAPDIDAIARRFGEREKAAPGAWLSMRGSTLVNVGNAKIAIDYGRPLARGRVILGDVVPYGRIWRTGANEATQITTSAPISVAGIELAAGAYTFWTLPLQDSVLLIVNRQTGQWGTGYRPEHDLARAKLQLETTPAVTDTFTIAVEPIDAKRATLVLAWDRFRWTAPIVAH